MARLELRPGCPGLPPGMAPSLPGCLRCHPAGFATARMEPPPSCLELPRLVRR